MKKLFTIGYEHATPKDFFDALLEAKVATLVDVRAVAGSRRPGFSKRQLAAGLEDHGMSYLHLQKLGTPKEGRLAARSGKAEEMLRIYERHLATPEAQHELEELTALAKSGRPPVLRARPRPLPPPTPRRGAAQAAGRPDREFVLRAGVTHLAPPAGRGRRACAPGEGGSPRV
jgi:uncharacterized protein (DUF488 family)